MASARPVADLGFLFIGGMHQALHMAPVALALARRPGVAITAYVPTADEAALARMFDRLDATAAPAIRIVPMALPWYARLARAMLGGERGAKPVALIAWRRRLLRHDALIAAERTSTLLKAWPGRRPVMIHIPHGAGDRAGGFDPRIRRFDHVLVNGPSVYDRTLAEGLATQARMTIIGSLKLAVLTGPDAPPPPRLFVDDRPVVVYNPHFDTRLSSWALARPLAEAIVADGRFNLIVAPHARLGETLGETERAEWAGLAAHPAVHVDFGSLRLGDMSYTRVADAYLGDVSSQLYEFLYRPRPAVFANAHRVAWAGDGNYRMWTLGEVAETVPDLVAALCRAAERHREFRDAQETAAAAVLGPVDAGVPERAADALLAALVKSRTSG